jgi:hypothetical protein
MLEKLRDFFRKSPDDMTREEKLRMAFFTGFDLGDYVPFKATFYLDGTRYRAEVDERSSRVTKI